MVEDGLAGFHHMGFVRVISCQFQGIVNLDRTTQVEPTAVKEGPSTVIGLMVPKVGSHLRLKLLVNLVHVMHHQDVFGRNGTIRLQLKTPKSIGMLKIEEGVAGSLNRLFELFFKK